MDEYVHIKLQEHRDFLQRQLDGYVSLEDRQEQSLRHTRSRIEETKGNIASVEAALEANG